MKKLITITSVLAIALVSISCSPGNSQITDAAFLPEVNVVTNRQASGSQEVVAGEKGLLASEEIDGLVFMREEEKLAHDLYLIFYEMWGLPIFENIASSEQTHMDSIAFLLEKYGIPDPAANNPAGVFTDPDLQDLYNELSIQGSLTAADALKTGAVVEEIDILDLRERIAQTQLLDILRIYTNLENGSNNHLRSFASVLENQTEEVYTPLYLSFADYQQIINSGMGMNRQGPNAGNGQGGSRNN